MNRIHPLRYKKNDNLLCLLNLQHRFTYGFVWFYGISTIVGHLMPNPVFTYIYILNT